MVGELVDVRLFDFKQISAPRPIVGASEGPRGAQVIFEAVPHVGAGLPKIVFDFTWDGDDATMLQAARKELHELSLRLAEWCERHPPSPS